MSLKKGWKTCTHHYLYPPPSGATAFGKCKKCGKVDQSKNYIEIQGWNNRFKEDKGRKNNEQKNMEKTRKRIR